MFNSFVGRSSGPLGGLSAQSGFWMPPEASTVARSVDSLFNLILGISAFFFILIVVLMVLFVIRYRARRVEEEALSQTEHNTPLELTWTGIPLLLVVVIFWLGFKGYLNMTTPPGDSYQVQVTAQKWSWLFSYPNGVTDGELHVPVDQPVKLVMSSQDVLHSLFVPSFRIKMDVLPGRYTTAWFRATKTGHFQIFCTEYCGKGHSDMLSMVHVYPKAEFDQWMEKAGNFVDTMPPVEAGAVVYKKYGCKQCHTIDGASSTGPTFKGLFGHVQALQGGGSVTVDENYVRESVLEPNAKVAAGFEPVMPTFKGRMRDKELNVLIEYVRSLK